MAGETWRAVGGVNRKVKEWYRSVGGVNQKIKKVYRGVNGVNREVFTSGIEAQYSVSASGTYPVKEITWGTDGIRVATRSTTYNGVTYSGAISFSIAFSEPITIESLTCSIKCMLASGSTRGKASVTAYYGTAKWESSDETAIPTTTGLILPYTFTDIVGQQCTRISMSLSDIWGEGYIDGETAIWTINGTEYAISIPENTPENTTFILESQ